MKNFIHYKATVFCCSLLFLSSDNGASFADQLAPLHGSLHESAEKSKMSDTQNLPINSPAWQIVAERENALHKIHNVWLRENIFFGRKLTIEEREKLIASQEDYLSKTAVPSTEIKRMVDQTVAEVEKGNTTYSDLNAVRIKDFRKVTIDTQAAESKAIDLFDGVKEGHFQNVGKGNSAEPNSKLTYSWVGTISKDKNFALDRSASFGLDILLMAMPISESFPPASSQWTVGKDSFVITTKKSDELALRLTLSKATGCPVSLERIQPKTNRVFYVNQVTKTKIASGIELPSEIVSYFASSGSETKYQFKYQLKSCKLNDEVDDSEALLPAGTQVTDYRLGENKAVGYPITDGKLFTDAQIQTLVDEDNAKEDALKTEASNRLDGGKNANPLITFLGLAIVSAGGLFVFRGMRG